MLEIFDSDIFKVTRKFQLVHFTDSNARSLMWELNFNEDDQFVDKVTVMYHKDSLDTIQDLNFRLPFQT